MGNPVCCECGQPIRKPRPDEGVDVAWTHVDENIGVICDEGSSYYDDAAETFHDARFPYPAQVLQ